MNLFSQLNIWAILVGAVAYWALGAVWYSPVLFSKSWVALNKITMTDEDKKAAPMAFITSFILMLIASLCIGITSHEMMIITIKGGIKLGLLIGAGFCATSISINYTYLRKPFGLYLIDCGYQVIGITIASVIIAAWK
jgi:hypothetical protein